MAMAMRLEVRHAQSLGLTPQLLQSIRLLQYDQSELRDFLRRESERNPLLRLRDRSPARPGARSRPAASFDTGERFAPERPSLEAHASAEIADALASPADRRIAEALLPDLDEAGYLRVDAAEAAGRLGVPPARIAQILSTLRAAAEPAGLFAGDLAECLALQLQRRNRFDPVMATILSRLDLVARREVAALSRLTGESPEGIAAILAELRTLDPRPGRLFEREEPVLLEPDVIVTPHPGGGWRVSLNPRAVPRLLVDEDYARQVLADCRTEAERAFVGECRTAAGWLARALDQRARSVLRVASEIVRRQEAFLLEGPAALRPMTLAAIAGAVGLHESTVSRVVANKAMDTPRGTIAMRRFLSAAIASADGGEASSAAGVRERIRRLVAAEEPGAVLSDEDIVAALRREGIDIARRTVAKYREALGIASSAGRRRELRLSRLAS